MSKEKKLIATALQYDRKHDDVTKLIAKGMGEVAQRIIDTAKQHDIVTYKDERLSNQLYNLSLGEDIPSELYEVVAEVLVFIAGMDARE